MVPPTWLTLQIGSFPMLRFQLPRSPFLLFALLSLGFTGCGGGSGNSGVGTTSPPAVDFSLSFSPASAALQAGSSISMQVTVVWTVQTNAPITISLTGLPQGVTATPASVTLAAGSSTTSLGLTATSAATVGSRSITATATAQTTPTIQHQFTLPLTVSAPAVPLPVPGRTSYILTGEPPESIVYDQTHKVLYACVPSLNQVLIIDPATHATLKTLAVPAAGQSDMSPDGSEVVVGSDTVAELTFISTASQTITRVVPFTLAESNVKNPFTATLGDDVLNPVFLTGGDVLFLSGFLDSDPSNEGPLYRWSASTGAITNSKAAVTALGAIPKSLSRSSDGSKVLVITSQYEMAVYDTATDSFTATNSEFASFAAADPANQRFAAFDSKGMEILDTSLNQLALLPFSTTTANSPYAMKFSLDGSKLFVAQSGLFSGQYAYRTVDATNYVMGQQAPLMSFDGDDEVSNDVDSEVPFAIDETNLIYGEGNRGIAIDDPLNYSTTSSTPGGSPGFAFFRPNDGPVGVPQQIQLYTSFATNTGFYFFPANGVPISAGTFSTPNGYSFITTPPIATAGPTSVESVAPDGSFGFFPAAYTYGVQATGMAPNVGPASGGITAYVTAYGLGGGASSVSVTVGGVAAKVTGVDQPGGFFPTPLPYYTVAFTVPPGTPGSTVDVTVTASGSTSTLSKAFTYAPQITNYPYPGGIIPTSLVYDPHRNYVYLLTNTQVDVFSLNSHGFLTPIIPPTLNGKLQLSGLDISIDGTVLAITNLSDQSVALLNPDNPTNAPKVVPVSAITSYMLALPFSVAATSKGTFFVLVAGGVYELNPSTGASQQRNFGASQLLRSTNGTSVLFTSANSSLGPLSLWSASTDSISVADTPGFIGDAAISGDGTTFSYFLDTNGGGSWEFLLDSSYNTLNNIVDPEGLGMSWLSGQFFNASGALLYIAGSNGIDVYDEHKGTLQQEIGVVEPYNPNASRAATIDDTGSNLFLLTNTGLDVIQDPPPLSVRSASPTPNTAPAGTVITLRGAGFQAGATITIGGKTVFTIFTDGQTISFTLPGAVADLAFTITNPDGSSYTY